MLLELELGHVLEKADTDIETQLSFVLELGIVLICGSNIPTLPNGDEEPPRYLGGLLLLADIANSN